MAPPGFPDFSRFFLIFGFCSKFALVSTSGKIFGKSGRIRKIRRTGHPPRFWGGETAEKFLGCFWVKNRATWALWDHIGQERPKFSIFFGNFSVFQSVAVRRYRFSGRKKKFFFRPKKIGFFRGGSPVAPPGFPDFSRFFLIFGFCSKFALVSTSGKIFGKSGRIRKIRRTGHPPRFWGGETAEKFLGCFWVKNRATWALWDHIGQERPKFSIFFGNFSVFQSVAVRRYRFSGRKKNFFFDPKKSDFFGEGLRWPPLDFLIFPDFS